MVRKRTRTASRRNYRKIYESDESSESESDLDSSSPSSSPAPKRYGLRQRKQQIFCEDFDYDEDELKVNKQHSDDEEYNVEVDLIEAKENHVNRTTKRNNFGNIAHSSGISISALEPEDLGDGLIDFEDVIRADVVINKQRLDYDNVINKTEIQVEPLPDSVGHTKSFREKGRRGRKPKVKQELTNTQAHTEEGNSNIENSHEEDTKLEVQIDPLSFVRTDSDESNPPRSNGVKSEKNVREGPASASTDKNEDGPVENGNPEVKLGPSLVENIEKFVPPELDDKEKEIVFSNEYLLGNSFDMSADEFLEKQAQKQDEVEEEEEPGPLIDFDDSNSDDDVVIIEKKPEIIVLDDD